MTSTVTKAVILASGGFGANLEMVTKYRPELEGFMTTNAKGALGDGILMGEEVGAATVDLEQIQIHPTVEMNTAALITEGLRGDGAILVNSNGQRFTDEVGTRDAVSAAEIKQPGSFAYLIVDQAMVDASNVIQGYIKKGYTTQGESYTALAEALQIDPTAFETTMNEWNAAVEAKTDSQFGRTSFASPLNTAPYYAIKVTPGVHHTMGGLKINSEAEVLTADGNKIPGLFAAGEVTGGVHGANRLGGNAVAGFVGFGRAARQQAAAPQYGVNQQAAYASQPAQASPDAIRQLAITRLKSSATFAIWMAFLGFIAAPVIFLLGDCVHAQRLCSRAQAINAPEDVMKRVKLARGISAGLLLLQVSLIILLIVSENMR